MASTRTKSGEVKASVEVACTARGMTSSLNDLSTLLNQVGITIAPIQVEMFERMVAERLQNISLQLKTSQLDEMKRRIFWMAFKDSGGIVPMDTTQLAKTNHEATELSTKELWQMIELAPELAYVAVEDLVPAHLSEPDFFYRTIVSLLPAEQFHILHALYCIT